MPVESAAYPIIAQVEDDPTIDEFVVANYETIHTRIDPCAKYCVVRTDSLFGFYNPSIYLAMQQKCKFSLSIDIYCSASAGGQLLKIRLIQSNLIHNKAEFEHVINAIDGDLVLGKIGENKLYGFRVKANSVKQTILGEQIPI
jgi:hypothetical protein